MAFVPRIHNRETPVANLPVAQRSHQEMHERHLRSLNKITSRVDSRWGRKWNGIREQKQASYPHVRANLKRAQIQDERIAAIELENNVLLAKLGKILKRNNNPTIGTRDWMGGMRLTQNQVPVIDHWIARGTTQFGAAVEPTSLNLLQRKHERDRIELENRALVTRLQTCRPTYDHFKFEQEARGRQQWLLSHAKDPRHLSPLRPASARETLATSPVGSTNSLTPGRASSSNSAPSNARRPNKIQPLQGRQPGPPPIDPSLLKVLDLLSSHMKGAAGSLMDMRQARETLMEGVCPMGDDVTFALMRAGDVEYEVVAAPKVQGDCSALLVLVHGGMFVTGSPRAVRHLAFRFSAELGVPVATPRLRVAPEEPFPAALDDLTNAYELLSSNGINAGEIVQERGDASERLMGMGVPTAIGIFAESSGSTLTMGMLMRRKEKGQALPHAVAMSSPWLDMTCNTHSYVANEKQDLVMQKKRMLGIARAYLVEVDPHEPIVSPMFAPADAFAGLPPMLIQVGVTEVLLDDARALRQKASAAGCDVTLEEWDGVLHAWHTFFPLMPRANDAVLHAVKFIYSKLGLLTEGLESERVRAAVKLQAVMRGKSTRVRLARERNSRAATLKLQAHARARVARNHMKQENARREQASIKLQAARRGQLARSETKEERAHQNAAAARLQSVQRGKAIRKRTTDDGPHASVDTPAHTSESTEQTSPPDIVQDAGERAAAIKLQSFGRGKKVRAEAEVKRAARERAAVSLQAAERGRAARERIKKQLQEESQAAVKLQKIQRGKDERKHIAAHAHGSAPTSMDDAVVTEPLMGQASPPTEEGKNAESSTMHAHEDRERSAPATDEAVAKQLVDGVIASAIAREMGTDESSYGVRQTSVAAEAPDDSVQPGEAGAETLNIGASETSVKSQSAPHDERAGTSPAVEASHTSFDDVVATASPDVMGAQEPHGSSPREPTKPDAAVQSGSVELSNEDNSIQTPAQALDSGAVEVDSAEAPALEDQPMTESGDDREESQTAEVAMVDKQPDKSAEEYAESLARSITASVLLAAQEDLDASGSKITDMLPATQSSANEGPATLEGEMSTAEPVTEVSENAMQPTDERPAHEANETERADASNVDDPSHTTTRAPEVVDTDAAEDPAAEGHILSMTEPNDSRAAEVLVAEEPQTAEVATVDDQPDTSAEDTSAEDTSADVYAESMARSITAHVLAAVDDRAEASISHTNDVMSAALSSAKEAPAALGGEMSTVAPVTAVIENAFPSADESPLPEANETDSAEASNVDDPIQTPAQTPAADATDVKSSEGHIPPTNEPGDVRSTRALVAEESQTAEATVDEQPDTSAEVYAESMARSITANVLDAVDDRVEASVSHTNDAMSATLSSAEEAPAALGVEMSAAEPAPSVSEDAMQPTDERPSTEADNATIADAPASISHTNDVMSATLSSAEEAPATLGGEMSAAEPASSVSEDAMQPTDERSLPEADNAAIADAPASISHTNDVMSATLSSAEEAPATLGGEMSAAEPASSVSEDAMQPTDERSLPEADNAAIADAPASISHTNDVMSATLSSAEEAPATLGGEMSAAEPASSVSEDAMQPTDERSLPEADNAAIADASNMEDPIQTPARIPAADAADIKAAGDHAAPEGNIPSTTEVGEVRATEAVAAEEAQTAEDEQPDSSAEEHAERTARSFTASVLAAAQQELDASLADEVPASLGGETSTTKPVTAMSEDVMQPTEERPAPEVNDTERAEASNVDNPSQTTAQAPATEVFDIDAAEDPAAEGHIPSTTEPGDSRAAEALVAEEPQIAEVATVVDQPDTSAEEYAESMARSITTNILAAAQELVSQPDDDALSTTIPSSLPVSAPSAASPPSAVEAAVVETAAPCSEPEPITCDPVSLSIELDGADAVVKLIPNITGV
ncbi:hypothetical protein AB1Y20_002913 [Prymnesium parvum]|uniref:Alpha/beta hydrolase fold-3 domain-containing protein n=1 Tax=Prymnesium parvum TaxID=97485 RepID=A0AB34J9C6_PRYPA